MEFPKLLRRDMILPESVGLCTTRSADFPFQHNVEMLLAPKAWGVAKLIFLFGRHEAAAAVWQLPKMTLFFFYSAGSCWASGREVTLRKAAWMIPRP
jgi:hypothetical protein